MRKQHLNTAIVGVFIATLSFGQVRAASNNWMANPAAVTLPPVANADINTTGYDFNPNTLGGWAASPYKNIGNGNNLYVGGTPNPNNPVALDASVNTASANAKSTVNEIKAGGINVPSNYYDVVIGKVGTAPNNSSAALSVALMDNISGRVQRQTGDASYSVNIRQSTSSIGKSESATVSDLKRGIAVDNGANYSNVNPAASDIIGAFNFGGRSSGGSTGGGTGGGDPCFKC